MSTRQIRRGRRAARSSTSQGSAEPLKPVRDNQSRKPGGFLEGKFLSDHGLLSTYKGQQGATNGQDSCGVIFSDAQGFGQLDAGSRAGFTSSRPPLSCTQVSRCSLFLHATCGLRKLGLVNQNGSERDLSALLLRTLAFGRRQQPHLNVLSVFS